MHSQDIDPFMDLRRELFPKLFQGGVYPPNILLIVGFVLMMMLDTALG